MGAFEENEARYMSMVRTILKRAKEDGCPSTRLAMKLSHVKICSDCPGDDCEKCGGAGLVKTCRDRDCVEYGCQGRGNCTPNKKDLFYIAKRFQ